MWGILDDRYPVIQWSGEPFTFYFPTTHRRIVCKNSLDSSLFLLHALLMNKAFMRDTALTQQQRDLILARYNQVKDLPIHLSLVEKSVTLIDKQDNRALFVLFDKGFKELGPLYPLVLIYSLYPTIVALYVRLGISETVRQVTLSDIAIWVKTYGNQHPSSTGLDRYGWICRHLCAKVIRLGRLQFEPSLFHFPYTIYYDSNRMQYRAFAQDSLMCSPDGNIGVEVDSVSGSWTTACSIADNILRAHEVDQRTGTISVEHISVPLSDLTLFCSQNTPVLAVHIPEGEPLTPSLVDASFSLAQAMFNPTLFVCDSWLLDPELSKVSPVESNICHFMQRFLKFPVAFTTPQIYERAFGFGATRDDVLAWECTTNLQKKVQAHIKAGGIFRTMGGYIPAPTGV